MSPEPGVDEEYKAALQRGVDSDARACLWAGVTGVCCGVMIVVCAAFMLANPDQRITMTSMEVFHDWIGLSKILRDAVAYDPRFNVPSVDQYARFETGDSSLMVLKDIYYRGLISSTAFANASALFNQTTGMRLVGAVDPRILIQVATEFFAHFNASTMSPSSLLLLQNAIVMSASSQNEDPRLLSRLFSVSGCSFPDAPPGTTPVTRSQGCRCIADAYVGFVKSTVNMTTNVTLSARDASVGTLMKCMNRRVTWHTWGAGDEWSIHPLGLVLYSNCVIFIVCVGFLLSFYNESLFYWLKDATYRSWLVKLTLCGVVFALSIFFWVKNAQGNVFQLIGLFFVLMNFIFSANSVLDYPGTGLAGDRRHPFVAEPHPLVVCFWINLPMLLPAPLVAVALAGYLRDVYALTAVAFIGSLLGSLLQRIFWFVWYGGHTYVQLVFTSLLLGFFDLLVLLLVLLSAYSSSLTIYVMSSPGIIAGLFFFIVCLFLIAWYDYHVYLTWADQGLDLNQRFEDGEHALLFLVTILMLLGMTAIAVIDAKKS